MFSTLTRYLFSYQTPTPNPSDDNIGRQNNMQLPTPVQATGPISRKPSSFTLDRSRGPSHVAWLTPTSPSPSPSRRSWPPKPGTRTSTPMSLAEGTSNPAAIAPAQQRALNRISSESFHLQSLYYLSELILESENAEEASKNRRLSSGGERIVEFPVTIRRPSTDSMPATLDSARPSDGHPSVSATSPTTPSSKTAFVNRPLNRTISQSSTSTFGTAASGSAAAPVIPPLDLRPNFSGSLGLTPRRSQLQPPSLPTVIASPRPQVSVIYEDSDIDVAESFRTAVSQRSSMFNVLDLERGTASVAIDPFADPEDYGYRVSAATNRTDRTDAEAEDDDDDDDHAGQSHISLPHGIYDEIDLGVPEQSTSMVLSDPSLPISPPWSPEASVLGTMPRRSMDSNGTMVNYAIKKRWRRGLSFGSFRTERRTWRPRSQYRFTSACILFWLGFIAPWCWLIGGWYLSRSGEIKPEGQFVNTVEWRWPRRKAVIEKDISQKKRQVSLFWQTRHEERKNEAKSMTPVEDNRSTRSLRLPASKEVVFIYRIDPWVTRCRVAAITSGILLAVAVVIALIVIAGVFA